MLFGTTLRISNHIYHKKWVDLIFEGLTQFVMLTCLFGFMDWMIVSKWLKDWDAVKDTEQPPGVILAMPTEDGLLLHQAGVRSITQRRGVMHQLLHFIQLRARERKQTLLIKDSPDWLSEALQRREFQLINGVFKYNNGQ